MYKIGEFSKITMISVKALRYYDEKGLLVPSDRSDNQYRMYNERDYELALLIKKLKKCGFTIAEIKEALEHCDDKLELNYILHEKKAFITENIKKEMELINVIEKMLLPRKQEVKIMEYVFETKNFEAVKVVSVRYKGQYSDMGKYIGSLYKAVQGKANGEPFSCYYDEGYQENAEIELCIPFSGTITSSEVTVKQLPAIKALCTRHVGSYDTLNEAYKAIIDHAKAKGLELKVPSREIYIKGPGMIFKGNADKYITDIVIPIA